MRLILRRQLREHWRFFAIIVPLILLMTWPAIIHVFDSGFWIPAADVDMWMKFWDAWHLGKILGGEGNLFHTNDIFYPQGTTLAFQGYSLPHALLMNALDAIMPASNAYTLAFLLLIIASALSAYIYLCWLLKDKWLAAGGRGGLRLQPVGHGRAAYA